MGLITTRIDGLSSATAGYAEVGELVTRPINPAEAASRADHGAAATARCTWSCSARTARRCRATGSRSQCRSEQRCGRDGAVVRRRRRGVRGRAAGHDRRRPAVQVRFVIEDVTVREAGVNNAAALACLRAQQHTLLRLVLVERGHLA